MAGLDGIRAVAVVAVLLFHTGVTWFGGGMLGVDIFFALSGYLITTMLVTEHRRSGGLRLGRFYERRARRLLPALFILVLGVAAYAYWFAGTEVRSSIRGDALSTLGYVSNWRFIFSDQGYFVHFASLSPLLHTWSLAVEEQFYLVWPLLALLVLRRRSARHLALVAGIGSIGSVAISTGLYHAGAGSARLYYATDTRAQAILVGACLGALGAWWSHPDARPAWLTERATNRAFSAAATAGALFIVWAVHSMTSNSPALYQGGFFLVALATAAIIVVLVRCPDAPLSRALSWGPLCYVGRISYGLYLYHWVIFLVLDNRHTGLAGPALLATRLLATFGVAIASFHLVEQPVRTGRLPRRLQLGIGLPFGAVATSALVVATSLPAAAIAPVTASAGSALSATMTQPRPSAITSGAASPVHVLLVGDSMGMTLGWGLAAGAEAWGVTITNQGMIGCDLDPTSVVNMEGSISQAAQGCFDWQSHWAAQVARLQPDVVAIALGRWEVSDRMIDGRWTRIGEPAWDRRLEALLSQAVDIASSYGAKVALFTLPYIQQTTEQPNGQPWDINQPVRTDAFNAVLRRVALRHIGTAAIVDINHLLDPNGHYTSLIDGIRVRDSDEEHPSVLGGEFVRPVVLPQLVGLAFWRDRGHRA